MIATKDFVRGMCYVIATIATIVFIMVAKFGG